MPPNVVQFDEFELDLGRYELRSRGRTLRLEKVPMELLILLVEREGQLVTRDEIVDRLWGPNVFVDTRQGINTAVRKIRLALKDDPDNPRILQTVFGRGYRLLPPVTIAARVAEQAEELSNGEIEAGPRKRNELDPGGRPAQAPAQVIAPVDPRLAQRLFLLIQAGYLVLYGAAFVRFPGILRLGLPPLLLWLILIAGLAGTSVRLYLIAAVAFDYPKSGSLFRQAFPGILALDTLWAASPLLLFGQIGYLSLLCVAALAFLPFSQRTLVSSIYRA